MKKFNIRPFLESDTADVINLLQYLWHGTIENRIKRFKWEYVQNPNHKGIVAVIAVSEDGEVVGFRGWVPGKVSLNDKTYTIVRAADVVVSPKARRQGVFERMTDFSLKYLQEKGFICILNLSSNKFSNHGYRKLGWQILSYIDSRYCFNLIKRKNDKEISFNCATKNIFIHTSRTLPIGLVINKKIQNNRLFFLMDIKTLRWLAANPQANYYYAWSENNNGLLTSLFVLSSSLRSYRLEYFFSVDNKTALRVFRTIKKEIATRFICVWTFALPPKSIRLLTNMFFLKIPFYKRIKKNTPILIRTLLKTSQGEDEWFVNGIDIRDANNWELNMLDAF